MRFGNSCDNYSYKRQIGDHAIEDVPIGMASNNTFDASDQM